ncbi:signal transduction histidine kinase [Catalinimonas alkaloidigena]|uniref:PAS domain-containing sensor histidine kinase n=1 Tax=Catalinimonas alkaloidigena TaxID=1075417 RepID=UPI002406DDD9|nr:PAS domain-containing sensor histidine kinase [Catalinimonas alkaloidigena]MDF9797041.1 signal transduction histidine kinase [Catalinimonas alkaloidigena]
MLVSQAIDRIYFYKDGERTIFSLAHPGDISKIKRLSDGNQHENNQSACEVRLKNHRSKYVWMELKCAYQYDERNQLDYIQFTALDITQRKQEELKVKHALKREKVLNVQLKQSKEEIDHFLYMASHNVRGPLATMMGLTQMLRKSSESTSKILEMIDQCLEKIDRSIHNVVLYEKNNKQEVKVDYVDFSALINEVKESFDDSDNNPQIEIHSIIPEDIIFYSDVERLKTIFEILIANAIAFKKPQHPRPYLLIKVKEQDGLLYVSFCDNGLGIKPEQLEKIFQIFYRSSSNSSGAGLGLYIAKKALQKIKGHIEVRSIYGKGTEFTLQLETLNKHAQVNHQ